MFLQLDGTFWIQLLNFVIFFTLLNAIFLRPVGAAIQKRREYINSVKHDYEAAQAAAAQLQAQAEAERAAARREAESTLIKARADVSNETAALAAQYAQQAAQRVEAANKTVAGELETARTDEERTVRDLADLMLSKTFAEPQA